MNNEEVTNLIAEARKQASSNPVNLSVDYLLMRLADALERSATETREAQAKAWDAGEECGALSISEGRVYDNPYRSVADAPEEDKP